VATELADELCRRVGAEHVEGLRRLSGGASRETWSFDAVMGDGRVRPLILRRDPPDAPKSGMAKERAVLEAAGAAGVPVPAVLDGDDSSIIMERLEGETIPRRILRDDVFADARPRMAAQCGAILAALHRVPVDAVPGLEQADQVAQFRELLDVLGEPHPAFELGFRWLEANRPARSGTAVVHGDFRHGNLMVGPEGVRAVLDWELVHVGDPMEDLGWLCVKAWRFGAPSPVGGFGTYDELVDAYEGAGGGPVDRRSLRWWEALGTLKWGIMCIMQAATHTSGALRSVELAAIGRRVCENELDLLDLIDPAGR
jgi:aminoglycoside phosphotransferase (APT) family kinase protein